MGSLKVLMEMRLFRSSLSGLVEYSSKGFLFFVPLLKYRFIWHEINWIQQIYWKLIKIVDESHLTLLIDKYGTGKTRFKFGVIGPDRSFAPTRYCLFYTLHHVLGTIRFLGHYHLQNFYRFSSDLGYGICIFDWRYDCFLFYTISWILIGPID